MSISLSTLKAICAAIALLFVLAQPAAAQLSFKPTADAVHEDQLLKALKEGDKITGRITIPDPMASSLIQPAGKDWRDFQRHSLPIIGGVAIIGMLALLTVFLMVRGRVRVEHGFSGIKILRFASFERFTHWLTASCFIILALSGLNISFGRVLILPIFGAEAFSTLTAWGKIAHNYLAFPFMFGLVIMFLIWVKDNIPGKLDLVWIRKGGGMLKNGERPAGQAFQCRPEGYLLDRDYRRRADVTVRLVPAVPLHPGECHCAAVLDRDPCRDRHAVYRSDACAHLYRHGRYGRRVRRHGQRRGGPQLGQGASFALG